jgi:hypothetical protein
VTGHRHRTGLHTLVGFNATDGPNDVEL